MQRQTGILDYGTITIESSRGDNEYSVGWDPEQSRYTCIGTDGRPCKHMQNQGKKDPWNHCRHIKDYLLDRFRSRVRVLESAREWPHTYIFSTFEQAYERIIMSKNEEVSYLGNMILSIAFHYKEVSSDDVYEIINGEFNTRGIMGITFKYLKMKKLIEPIRWVNSRTPTNHGASIAVYRLTEEGRKYIEGALKI